MSSKRRAGPVLAILDLFEPSSVVHRAVQVAGLPRIVGAQHHPGVRGQLPGFLRVTRFAELAAGARQHPGERVNGVVFSRHG